MSTKTKRKPAKSKTPASIVWFEIPVDDSARAKKFYGNLFGWKINPMSHMADYRHIDTAGADASPDGALIKPSELQQLISPGIPGNLHDRAWDDADRLVKLWRAKSN